jgi:hypothetical protein
MRNFWLLLVMICTAVVLAQPTEPQVLGSFQGQWSGNF